MTKQTILVLALGMIAAPTLAAHAEQVSFSVETLTAEQAIYVLKIDELAPTEKPTCDALAVEVFDDNGKTKTLKPSAAERDEAYAFWLSAKQPATPSESVAKVSDKRVVIEFTGSYKSYVKGDQGGFRADIASQILALKPAVARKLD
jgi:hypothetical protein